MKSSKLYAKGKFLVNLHFAFLNGSSVIVFVYCALVSHIGIWNSLPYAHLFGMDICLGYCLYLTFVRVVPMLIRCLRYLRGS